MTQYNLLGSPRFIGFDNFAKIAQDKLFWNALVVTVEYVVLNIVFQTIIAVGLAVLMHRLTKSTVIRGTILLPFLISNVIAALVWFWLLDYQIGIVNEVIAWTRAGPHRRSSATRTGPSPRSPSSTSGGTWATPRCWSSPDCR